MPAFRDVAFKLCERTDTQSPPQLPGMPLFRGQNLPQSLNFILHLEKTNQVCKVREHRGTTAKITPQFLMTASYKEKHHGPAMETLINKDNMKQNL